MRLVGDLAADKLSRSPMTDMLITEGMWSKDGQKYSWAGRADAYKNRSAVTTVACRFETEGGLFPDSVVGPD